MTAKVLMIQGTSSYAGKSLMVTALCRIFSRLGLNVAPFKAQNMSNNAAVCPGGGEIGRAQELQATAAGIDPTVDMNPVLLKPETDMRSQVIVLGHPWRTLPARNYYNNTPYLWKQVTNALDRLREKYDLVIIEGAGSPVELNLREGDIVNMAIAKYAQSPVLLVGDIDRGGIFAQLLGTLWLLKPDEYALVRGLIVNKFRGDLSLFTDGITILEEKSEVPVLGVVPYVNGLYLPEEDGVCMNDKLRNSTMTINDIDIAIISLPHIANIDDFNPLRAEPGIHVRHVSVLAEFGNPGAVIIPGTKSTIADLEWLRRNGLFDAISEFANKGGVVVGICGGYQMLGTTIYDTDHIESEQDCTYGLDLLPVVTHFQPEKATFLIRAYIHSADSWMAPLDGLEVRGYEIHAGVTCGDRPWLEITMRNNNPVCILDGSLTQRGRIWGCYLHGLFTNDEFRHTWLRSLGWGGLGYVESHEQLIARSLDLLADSVEHALKMDLLNNIINQ